MKIRMTWLLFRRVAAQIFLGGLQGIAIGVCAGAAVGVFFFVIGALFGAVIAIPLGFCAGIIGVTIGGRWGWAFGGALSLVVPIAYAAICNEMYNPLANNTSFAIVGCGAAVYGASIGYWHGGRVQSPLVETDEPAVGQGNVYVSLYDIPFTWRIFAALAVCGTVVTVLQYIYNLGDHIR